jgi:hypothetical protein
MYVVRQHGHIEAAKADQGVVNLPLVPASPGRAACGLDGPGVAGRPRQDLTGHPVDVCSGGAPLVIGPAGLVRSVGPLVAVDRMPLGALTAVLAVLIGVQAAVDTFHGRGDHRLRLQFR